MRSRPVAAAVVLLGLAFAPPVVASDGVPDAQIRTIYEAAMGEFQAQRFEQAAHLFDTAHTLRPSSTLLWNAARAFHRAGKKEPAGERYLAFLKLDGVAWGNRRKAARYLAEVAGEAAVQQAGYSELARPPGHGLPGQWDAALTVGGATRELRLFLLEPHLEAVVGGVQDAGQTCGGTLTLVELDVARLTYRAAVQYGDRGCLGARTVVIEETGPKDRDVRLLAKDGAVVGHGALLAPGAPRPKKKVAKSGARRTKAPALPTTTELQLRGFDAILQASERLPRWIGLQVEVELVRGVPVRGRLTGVRNTQIVLEQPDGRSWTGDLFDAKVVRLAR